ncbi:MAG: hypothetical protein IKR57_06050 [Bacilli bacterium]|nr:hypothetical protein [Bacilli bacterium]
MDELVLAIIVVLVLLSILTILFVFTVKRVNILMKKIFVDKLQEYDYLIDDKEKKIDSLDDTIDKKTKAYAKLEQEVYELEKTLEDKVVVKTDNVVLPTDADFEDGNILSGYKKIKSGFNFDVTKEIEKFVSNIKDSKDEYEIYCNVRSYFTPSVIYTFLTYSSENQKKIINDLLEENEKKLLEKELNVKKFNITNFINKLDVLIQKTDPNIFIYTGNEKDNFNEINENITTVYDKNITEGFKIVYKGVVYDYSI